MTPDTPADGAALAQCCMCGKTDLSTAEDGGQECELHDGRWVCSRECWDIAVSIIDRLIPRPAEPAQTAQVDVMVNLYVQLENLLAVYSEPDKQLCCDGHMCGCQGATEYQQAEHYAKAALDEARAALQHKDDTHGPE